MRAQARLTRAGQDRLYDIITFNSWITAKTSGQGDLAAFYQRRFRPEYARAFAAWLRLDPFHNATVPAGPIFMHEYEDANATRSNQLAALANHYFETGVSTSEKADDYVRITVSLATVLFLTALSQRFSFVGPRTVVIALAALLLLFSTFQILTLPRM